MKPSPIKQNPALALTAWVSMLCLLLLALTPAASAARMSGAQKAMRRMRWMPRVENGIVTDGDGIIGNSATGADHARHARRPRPAHKMTGADIPPDPIIPELPQNGGTGGLPESGAGNNVNRLPDGTDMLPGDANDPMNGMLPDASQGDVANDPDGHIAGDGENRPNGTSDATDKTDDTAAKGVLPWIIGIIVLLGIVLIVLSLMPKRRNS